MLLLRVLLFAALSFASLAARAADPSTIVTREGTVIVQVEDDFQHARSQTRYFLVDRRTSERVELRLSPEQSKRVRFGQELRVRGKQHAKVLEADPDAAAVAVLSGTTSLVAPAASPTTARRLLTFIVDITDGSGNAYAVDTTCDASQVLADELFGSQTGGLNVDGCYRDASYDLLGFGGSSYPGTGMDVVRVAITDPSPSLASVCNVDLWASSADAAAVARGVDLDAYQHRMYVLPAGTTGCLWGGLAFVGCAPGACRSWVHAYGAFPCGYPDIIAHELGHNLGLLHARIGTCVYCDTSDLMGYGLGRLRTFNAPHKDYLGWLGADRIVDGTGDGVFTISALGMQSPPFPQVVKIFPPSGGPIWLSYRAPIGYDAQLEDQYLNSLQVHRAEEAESILVGQVSDGGTLFAESINLLVKPLSHTADSATFEVQYGHGFSLSPSSLAFGSQQLGVASPAQSVTVLSTGTAPVAITSIDVGGGPASTEFAQTNNCGSPVPAGASCTINVTFKPSSPGSKETNLIVGASGGIDTKYVSLTGTGVGAAYTLSTTSLAFGNQLLNIASSAKTITVRSTGVTALPITSIAIGGTAPGQFAQTNNCGTSLAAGASCAIRVTFKPTSTGAKTATLKLTAGGAAGTKSASLSGTGVKAVYSLSPTALGFGNQPLNLISSAKTITLANTGGTIVPITSISIGGSTPGQFAQTNTCGTSLAAGASCAIKVTFKATSTGAKAAILSVVAAGGGGIKSVTLSGTGVRSTFSVAPTALSFGNVARNTASTAKTVKVTNTGTVLLPISSIAIAGTNPGQFTRTSNCPARVAIGGSCAVSVVFKPTSAGAKSATLQVNPGGGAALKSVALTGNGV